MEDLIYEYQNEFTDFEMFEYEGGVGVFAARRDDCLSFVLQRQDVQSLYDGLGGWLEQ